MKQKRKGASLFSSKKRLEIVSLLGILGGVLCIASVGLLNKSAMAAAGDTTTMKLDYTGIGDDTEVVYNVSFVSETDNSKDLLNIYKKDSNLYITPNNVVVNPSTAGVISRFNKVEGGVYGHVLGGNGNRISSANVTIIAGESNVVNSNNANATILGGKQNVLYAGSGSRVAVLVGGYNNRVYNSNNPVNIIGGRNNEISDAASNATILGGSGNVVGGANAIVGGLGVGVPTGVEDVFVFSERGLGLSTSDSSEAFYLDVLHGLGINVDDSTTNGVEVGGAMGFGEIDINNECGESNYGLQGTWNGCLVGCTTKGWELLDTSEYCKHECAKPENDKCIDKDALIPTPTTGFCEGNLVVDNVRMHRCANLHPENYYDTTFEKVVIDSDKACPTGDRDPEFGNNQCVYQCNKDGNGEYHLIKNEIDMPSKGLVSGDKGCYKSCERDGKQIDHGQTEIWYSKNPVSCAYPDNDDTMDPKSVYTCGLYKATLMCVDGELYTVRDEGGDLVPDQKDNEHVYSSCDLYSYECSSDYTLSADDITSGPFEDVLNTVNDRGTSYGNRGKYKLCISYDAIPNETCNAYDWRYEVKCNSGTTAEETFEGSGKYKCAYMCTDRYGNKVPHGTQTGAYKSQSVQCEWEVPNPNNRCERVTVTCEDGVWRDAEGNANTNWNCSTVSTLRCDGYNVKKGNYETLINKIDSTQESFYSSCGWNKGNGLECEETTSFKFDGCGDGYNLKSTTLPGLHVSMDVCEKIPTCGTSKSGEECNDSALKGTVKEKVTNGLTGHQWQCEGTYGTLIDCEEFFRCNNDAPSGAGVILTQKYPTTTGEQKNWTYSSSSQNNLKACEYTCAEGYHDNGNGCSPNQCKGSNPTGTKVNSDKRPAEHDSVEWTCDATSTDACTYSCEGTNVCNSDKTGCELGEKDCILPKPTGSAYKLGYGKYTEGYTPTKWTYTSSSDPLPCEYTCNGPKYVWSGGICTGATIEPDYQCVGAPWGEGSTKGYIISTKTPTASTTNLTWHFPSNPSTTSGTINNEACQYLCDKTCYESSDGGRCIGKEVKVKYACGGSGNVVEEVGRYTQYTLSYSACKTDSYEVVGWSKTKGGNTDYMPGDTYDSCEGITLYPILRYRPTNTCNAETEPKSAGAIKSTLVPSFNNKDWTMAASGTKEGDLKACEFTCNTCYHGKSGDCDGDGFKIQYNCGGGNIVEEGMIYGRLATMKLSTNACSKTNYELKGWTKTSGSTSIDYDKGGQYDSCIGTTLYPVYEYNPTCFYTIDYDANGGTPKPSSETVVCGDWTMLASAPDREHYRFAGWWTEAQGGVWRGDALDRYAPGGSETLYAHWEYVPSGCAADTHTYGDCSYSIGAMVDGQSNNKVNTSTNNRNGSVTVSCNDGTLSYDFESCAKSTSCGTAPSNSSWVKSTYVQSWLGSVWNPSSKPSNTCVTSDSSTTECSFKCNGNKVCDGNGGCKDPDPSGCAADTYTYGDCSFSVGAMAHNGSDTVNTSTSGRNGSVKVSCSNGKLSYSNPSCGKSISCGTAPSNSSWVKSAYAQTWNGSSWTPSSKSKTCVTSSSSTTECSFICNTNYECDGNTGCKAKTQSTSCGTAPSNSSWVKSTFTQTWNGSSWTPSSKSKTCVTSSSSTTECSFKCNTNYECDGNTGCKSVECSYTITYNANGGTASSSSVSVSCGSGTTLANATRTNYTFDGWYTSKNGGTKAGDAGASYTPSDDVTLYAHWTEDSFSECADYPLTSCDFPGAVHCSKCPSDSSKMKLEVCAPTYDSFAPHEDERGVTYWIKTDGTCPEGAICAPANVTWYTKNGNTCIASEHNNKIIGCKECYKKAYMGPECVYDASYCGSYTLKLEPNKSDCNSATYILKAGEQFKDKLNPPAGSPCSSQHWAGWYTEKNGGTKYQGGDTMPASDLTLYGHWSSPSSNGICHTSNVGHPCIEAYYNGSPNTSWTNYVQQTSENGWVSYCSSKTSKTSCQDAGATLMTQYGNYYNGWNNTTKYKAISNYSTYQTTNAANVSEAKYQCCEWSGPSS